MVLQGQLTSFRGEISGLRTEVGFLQSENEEVVRKNEEVVRKNEELEEMISILSESQSHLTDDTFDEDLLIDTEGDAQESTSDWVASNQEKVQLQQENRDYAAKMEEKNREFAENKARYDTVEQEKTKLQGENKRLQNTVSEQKRDIAEKDDEINQLNKQKVSLKCSRVKLLEAVNKVKNKCRTSEEAKQLLKQTIEDKVVIIQKLQAAATKSAEKNDARLAEKDARLAQKEESAANKQNEQNRMIAEMKKRLEVKELQLQKANEVNRLASKSVFGKFKKWTQSKE
jgi:chromosome segregation ATPase